MNPVQRREVLKNSAAVMTGFAGGLAGCSAFSSGPRSDQTPATDPRTPTDEAEDPTPILTTDHSDLRSAIESAAEGDTVVVDTDHTLSRHINLPSNITLSGGGGTVRLKDESASGSMLRLENVENVRIDGLHLDGNRRHQTNAGGGLIGGLRLGTVSNVRITNCVIENAYSNGIMFGDKTPGEGRFTDIYIANNRVTNCHRHGIIMGVKNAPGSIQNVLMEGNDVYEFDKAIGITVYGVNGVDVNRVAIIGNRCENTGGSSNGTAIAFEEQVHNCIAYGNSVDMWGPGSVNGIVSTKDAHHCIIGNNRVRNCRDGLGVMNFPYYQPEGPPKWNLITHNDVQNCRSGFAYRNLEGELTVYRNYLANNRIDINNQGNNSGDAYYFSSNGSDISSESVGLPETLGSSVTYVGPDGGDLGWAEWSRGSISSKTPVSVEVHTTE